MIKMSRQVDVKALVSHIVRGDGMDRCRICMGDTSEGQVYLGDTVVMDGSKPITLSELLAIITGVEVALEEDLPPGICGACSSAALAAASFRSLCNQGNDFWNTSVAFLTSLPNDLADCSDSSVLVTLTSDNMIISSFSSEKKEEGLVDRGKKGRKRVRKQECHCPDCGKVFQNPQYLFEHLKGSADQKRSCFICAEVMQRDKLLEHLKGHHGIIPYDCKKCPAVFETEQSYTSHIAKFHINGEYLCGECGKCFKSQFGYNGHVATHAPNECLGCKLQFRNRRCYLHHIQSCTTLDKISSESKIKFEIRDSETKQRMGARGRIDKSCYCDYCGKKFAGKRFVCAHIQIVHLKNTHKPCPHCGKRLAAAHMSTHMQRHAKADAYTCEHCGVTLKSKLGHVQHLRLHTGEKPYKCKYCAETFSASSRRSEHVRNVHAKDKIVLKYACEHCPAKFRLPYRLKKHVETVHECDNKMEYECKVCQIKFGSCRGLLHHSRKHQTFTFKADRRDKKIFSKHKDC